MTASDKIIVAADYDTLEEAELLVSSLDKHHITLKIGNQLGTYSGWRACIALARAHDTKIFCDTKFKDIPETVKKSARSITRLQPDMFTIMADNSPAALRAAVVGVDSAIKDFDLPVRPLILGVTVLTSLDDEECTSVYGAGARLKVLQFARAAANAGLDGIICSASEAEMLRADTITSRMILITPGIRPKWSDSADQSRVVTPTRAVRAGADYVVIGRPITQPPATIGSPQNAIRKIIDEMRGTDE